MRFTSLYRKTPLNHKCTFSKFSKYRFYFAKNFWLLTQLCNVSVSACRWSSSWRTWTRSSGSWCWSSPSPSSSLTRSSSLWLAHTWRVSHCRPAPLYSRINSSSFFYFTIIITVLLPLLLVKLLQDKIHMSGTAEAKLDKWFSLRGFRRQCLVTGALTHWCNSTVYQFCVSTTFVFITVLISI